MIDCNFSAVHLSVIHCQRSAAENLLSVLSTLPNDMAVNDRNDLLQVTASLCRASLSIDVSKCDYSFRITVML